MARVRSLTRGSQTVKLHPSEVDCFFQVVESEDWKKYLHLSAFGSDARASGSKSSQSIQLDATAAQELVEILHETFGL
jgi:hypothetical protein